MSDTEKEQVEPGVKLPPLRQLLNSLEGAPSPLQIDAWKQEYGEVFVSGFSEEELYIFRPLKRNEWKELRAAAANSEGMDELKFEEMVVSTCVLFPALAGASNLANKAGTVTTLNEQVMQHSNFIPPALALSLVQKL